MGTAHQPVQGVYFYPHNEKYICHLELSWQLRETKILVEIENDPKGWRTRALVFAAHTVIISDGWKQEGLELTSQNDFSSKTGLFTPCQGEDPPSSHRKWLFIH